MEINIIDIIIVVAIMLVVAVVFGFLIMVVSKKFAVDVDEREENISGCLAGANCGGCGHAGCGAMAHALVEGKGKIDDCPVTAKSEKIKIAEILGVDYSGGAEYKLVVACGGGNNATDRSDYLGNKSCIYQNMIGGGKKLCKAGCIGDGSCVIKCAFGAMNVENGVAEINQDLCTKCGACAKECPKNLVVKIPAKAKIYVCCSTKCRGKEVMDACKNGCIGCGICAKNCPNGAITMVDNLPVIDYDKCVSCGHCVEKCPKHVIRKID